MTDELKHLQTIREIREVLRCKCPVDYTSRGTHGPDCVDYLVDDLDEAWNTRAGLGASASGQDGAEAVSYASPVCSLPKVKKLGWLQMNNKPDRVQKGEWWTGKIRNCPFGWLYDVHEFRLMSGKTVYSWSRGPEAQIDVASIEEGKAAAQADYDARIRAALVDEPSEVE